LQFEDVFEQAVEAVGPEMRAGFRFDQSGAIASPPHLSKGEGYVLAPGDWIAVKTPGGGGYGPAAQRDPTMVERDIARGYYTDVQAVRLFTRTQAAAAE
jgi:N-methylhydantoinase B